MNTYLIPYIDGSGQQRLLRVRATSLSDARTRAGLLMTGTSRITGNPTKVRNADGTNDEEGISSIHQNFGNIVGGGEFDIDAISAFPVGFSAEDVGTAQTAGTGSIDDATRDAALQLSAFRNFISGQGTRPDSLVGEALTQGFQPATVATQNIAGQIGANVGGSGIRDFLASIGGPSGIPGQARNVFNRVAGLDVNQQNPEGISPFIDPTSPESIEARQSRALAQGAQLGGNTFSALNFGNQAISRASQQFFDQINAGQDPGNFLGFLRQRIGAPLQF